MFACLPGNFSFKTQCHHHRRLGFVARAMPHCAHWFTCLHPGMGLDQRWLVCVPLVPSLWWVCSKELCFTLDLVIPYLLVDSQRRWCVHRCLRLHHCPGGRSLETGPCPRESEKCGIGNRTLSLGFRTLAVSLAILLGQGTLTHILGVYESEARIPV